MTNYTSIRILLPAQAAAWVGNEVAPTKQSRILWIGNILTDHFQGQEPCEVGGQSALPRSRQFSFMNFAPGELLTAQPDCPARSRLRGVYRHKMEQNMPEWGA